MRDGYWFTEYLPPVPSQIKSDLTVTAQYREAIIGEDWYVRDRISGDWSSLCFGDGKFVATNRRSGVADKIIISHDGINWNSAFNSNGAFYSICYGNGMFLAISDNYMIKSSNGIDWVEVTNYGSGYTFTKAYYSLGDFLILGYSPPNVPNGSILKSSNTSSWTVWQTPIIFNQMSSNNTIWLYSGSDGIYSSPDKGSTLSILFATSPTCMTYGADKFVLMSSGNSVKVVSSDTITYKDGYNAEAGADAVCYGNDRFVAVRKDYQSSSL